MRIAALILALLATPAAAQQTAESYRDAVGNLRDGMGVTVTVTAAIPTTRLREG